MFLDKVFSKYQCVFRKGFSAQQGLIKLLEQWKKSIDQGLVFGALWQICIWYNTLRIGDNLESKIKQNEQAAKLLFQWFSDNQMKGNMKINVMS